MLLSCAAPILVCSISWADDLTETPPSEIERIRQRGQQIYAAQCAMCHGDQGQGDVSAYEDPLQGDDSVGQLADTISETMPEDNPEDCVDDDALAVAEYIHHAFYGEAARVRSRPPQIDLARLTASQLQQSLADLYAAGSGQQKPSAQRGVRGEYFAGDRWKKENRKIERIDPVINFDFGHQSPGKDIKPEEFYIAWQGGLRIDTSGRYDIIVDSSCSFTMDFGRDGRELIDNHVQSGAKTEFRRTLELTAGRVYPFKIEFRQRKRKTELPPANIALSWVPPGGVQQIIPSDHLIPEAVAAAFSLQTPLPPDDRSYGFQRGVAINRQWDESTTAAAIEFADVAYSELWPAYQQQHRRDPNSNRQQLKDFLAQRLRLAFRGDLDATTQEHFVDRQVDAEPDDREAIKRVFLLGLKAPRFLYPGLDLQQPAARRVANQLALVMYDSVPVDPALLKLANLSSPPTEKSVREYVRGNLDDLRLRAKFRGFIHEWLNIGHIGELTKNPDNFPGFDAALQYDLRRSLDAFVEEIVWSPESDFRQLFLADWSFTTPRIAELLGESWQAAAQRPLAESDAPAQATEANTPATEALTRTPADSAIRSGVLNHPYLMSGLAYYDNTSPIHRGVFLLRYTLGRTLRPPNEAFTPLSPDLHPDLTTRQRVSLQTSPESCQVCHSKINALGFALENFDAVGRFRAEDRNKPIDPTGSYISRDGKQVEFSGHVELAKFLAESQDAHEAFVRKAFQHFVKQPPAAYGPETLQQLTQQFRDQDFNIQRLIEDIIVVAAMHVTEE